MKGGRITNDFDKLLNTEFPEKNRRKKKNPDS